MVAPVFAQRSNNQQSLSMPDTRRAAVAYAPKSENAEIEETTHLLRCLGYHNVPDKGMYIGRTFLPGNHGGARLINDEGTVVDVGRYSATSWNLLTQTPGRGTHTSIGAFIEGLKKQIEKS